MTDITNLDAERLSVFDSLKDALNRAGLPVADLEQPGRMFFRFNETGKTIGYGGLEGAGSDMLLRSVAVAPDVRNRGSGSQIVAALEREAAALGAKRLHLLTTTAARFFDRRGYKTADRAAAPAPVRACEQFRSLCPANAAYLVKDLKP